MKKLQYEMLPVSQIVADPNQPRKLFDPELLKSLKNSVSRYGIKNPVTVEKLGNKYLLIDGERRFRVATELKLKEIPAVIEEPKNAVDRLIVQFHLQEQHAQWTPTEKAVTVSQLAKELKVSLKDICEMLSIPKGTAQRYVSFADIIDKKAFHQDNIGIEWAPKIQEIKRCAKKQYELHDKVFTKLDEAKLEKTLLRRIKEGELSLNDKGKGHNRVKDTFVKDYKMIDKFINDDISTDEMFIGSKAKSVMYARSMINNANFMAGFISSFLAHPIELTSEQIGILKHASKYLKILLDKVD